MSEKNTGGPAFPQPALMGDNGIISANDFNEGGMTLRDYFAAKAMQGFITNHDTRRSDLIDVPQLAKSAYNVADAMLKARVA